MTNTSDAKAMEVNAQWAKPATMIIKVAETQSFKKEIRRRPSRNV